MQMAKEVTANELACFILRVLLVSLAVLPPLQAQGSARENGTRDASLCLLLKPRTAILPRHMP